MKTHQDDEEQRRVQGIQLYFASIQKTWQCREWTAAMTAAPSPTATMHLADHTNDRALLYARSDSINVRYIGRV